MGELEQVLRREEQALYRLRALYQSRGYRPYKMNKFEEYDLYARNKSFLQSEQILTFTDTDGRLMALKPDVTLSIIKNAKETPGLQKLCYNETVYRPSGAYGGFREIMQAGLECIGELDLFSMGEVILLAVQSLSLVAERYLLDLSHLGVLTGALDELTGSEPVKRELLRCIGQKNLHELAALCGEAGLSETGCRRLQALAKLHGPLAETIPALEKLCPSQTSELAELEGLHRMLETAGMADNVVLDLSIGGDMRYYNGLIFQGFVDGAAEPILSGGRYDSLVKKLGKRGGAIGFAVYLDLLERFDRSPDYDVDALLLYKDGCDPVQLQKAAAELRNSGKSVRVERSRPEGLHCRQLYQFREGRAEYFEEHA